MILQLRVTVTHIWAANMALMKVKEHSCPSRLSGGVCGVPAARSCTTVTRCCPLDPAAAAGGINEIQRLQEPFSTRTQSPLLDSRGLSGRCDSEIVQNLFS